MHFLWVYFLCVSRYICFFQFSINWIELLKFSWYLKTFLVKKVKKCNFAFCWYIYIYMVTLCSKSEASALKWQPGHCTWLLAGPDIFQKDIKNAIDPNQSQICPSWLTSEICNPSFSISLLQECLAKMFTIQVIFLLVCHCNVTGLKQKSPTLFLVFYKSLSHATSVTSKCSWDITIQVNVDLASEASFSKNIVKK